VPSFHDILFAFLLPGCLAGAIFLAAARAAPPDERGMSWNALAGAWALGLAYAIAHVELAGWPAWPSAQRTPSALDWLGWTVIALLPASLLFIAPVRERTLARGLRGVFATAFVLVSLQRWMRASGSPWIALCLVLVLIAVWEIVDGLVRRSPGPVPILALLVATTCVSVSLLLANSALVAELVGTVCVGLGAAAVASAIAPRFRFSSGAVAVLMLVLAGALENGVLFGDLHWASALFAALALVAPLAAERMRRTPRNPWASAAVRAAIAAAFGAGAIAIAHLNAPSYEY
jgi:hypothetical protein